MKHKRKHPVPIPLKMVTEFEQKFPGCYQICDDLIKKARGDSDIWEKVYIPISASNAVMGIIYGDMTKGTILHALYSWRQAKQIFVFEKNLCEEILKTEQAEKVPLEALESIPYYAFYINFEYLDIDIGKIFSGFFVTFEEEERERELRITAITSLGEVVPFYLPLKKDKTISDSLSESRGAKKMEKILRVDFNVKNLSDIILKFLSLIVYICCKNADIAENPEQRAYRRSYTSTNLIKDIPREIQILDVGCRLWEKLRRTIYANPKEAVKKGGEFDDKNQKRKRPHIRSAHYHHFWTGKRGTPERKLVVKWIPPIAVNLEPEKGVEVAIVKKIIEKRNFD